MIQFSKILKQDKPSITWVLILNAIYSDGRRDVSDP